MWTAESGETCAVFRLSRERQRAATEAAGASQGASGVSKRATAKNVVAVVRKLADLIESEPRDQLSMWARDINQFLDGLADQDAFGTEGQLDPRGDQRG